MKDIEKFVYDYTYRGVVGNEAAWVDMDHLIVREGGVIYSDAFVSCHGYAVLDERGVATLIHAGRDSSPEMILDGKMCHQGKLIDVPKITEIYGDSNYPVLINVYDPQMITWPCLKVYDVFARRGFKVRHYPTSPLPKKCSYRDLILDSDARLLYVVRNKDKIEEIPFSR